ncbi:hypothetical protein F353_gp16 [Vibrio phage CP-T1]|nr:hypothetical protein F353_gp16 [Vibrio phage CP-T1]YP_007006405.1 hypothetical protein F397_gp16 [Vibrio phage vB_VchM-138]AFC22398.1 hypothetical protein CP-T1_0016 [Vibrio phage CP-T1]AFC22695.1 hypothetical protein VchM-138_0016 [Vibrio phage vB_VchM-138]AIA08748.1 hypothetical protein SBVc24_0059 [Vibrio phage 24]
MTNHLPALKSLAFLMISNQSDRVAVHEVSNVIAKLMLGEKPSSEEMDRLSLAYQRDPVLCTLDYQDLCEFIDEKFKDPQND